LFARIAAARASASLVSFAKVIPSAFLSAT